MLGPARDARASSPPPFWCFTSWEFLWKQSLEILPSLGSAGHYPGGPAAEPRPAAGVCVCQCLALEIYNLWQQGGAAFGSSSSVLKQRPVARAPRRTNKHGGSNRPRSHLSPHCQPLFSPSLCLGTCLHLAGPLWACFFTWWLCRSPLYFVSPLPIPPFLSSKCLTSVPSFPCPLSLLGPPS